MPPSRAKHSNADDNTSAVEEGANSALLQDSAHRVLLMGLNATNNDPTHTSIDGDISRLSGSGIDWLDVTGSPTVEGAAATAANMHSKMDLFGHWSSTAGTMGALWSSVGNGTSRVSRPKWRWFTFWFIVLTALTMALQFFYVYANEDADRLLQRRRQEMMASSFSTLISSRFLSLATSMGGVGGLIQGSMIASSLRSGQDTKNGAPIPNFAKYAAAGQKRVLRDQPAEVGGLETAQIATYPRGITTESYPPFAPQLGVDNFATFLRSYISVIALRGIISIGALEFSGSEYLIAIHPIFNKSAPQVEQDLRLSNHRKYNTMSHEELQNLLNDENVTTFNALDSPKFVSGLWGWVSSTALGRPFVNATGIKSVLQSAIGGTGISWCLYTVSSTNGERIVLGSSNVGNSSSGSQAEATSLEEFLNSTAENRTTTVPIIGAVEYCAEMLNSPLTTKVTIPTRLPLYTTYFPWVLLVRSNSYENIVTDRVLARVVMYAFIFSFVVVVAVFLVILYRSTTRDSASRAPKTAPFTFMTVRLVEGEMLWKHSPVSALDTIERFASAVRDSASKHDLYECMPAEAPHVLCFTSRRVGPAIYAAESLLENISHLRYSEVVSSELHSAEVATSHRMAERRVLVDELERRAEWCAKASPQYPKPSQTQAGTRQKRQTTPPSFKSLLKSAHVRPFLVQVLIQRCDNGRVLFDVQSKRFKYTPTYCRDTVHHLMVTSLDTCVVPSHVYLTEEAAREAKKTLPNIKLNAQDPIRIRPSASRELQLFTCITTAGKKDGLSQYRDRTRVQLANRTLRDEAIYEGVAAAYEAVHTSDWGNATRHLVGTAKPTPQGTATVQSAKKVSRAPLRRDPVPLASKTAEGSKETIKQSEHKSGAAVVWGVSGTASEQDASRHIAIPPLVDAALRRVFDQYLLNFTESLERAQGTSSHSSHVDVLLSPDELYERFRIRLYVYVNALKVILGSTSKEERAQLLDRLGRSFHATTISTPDEVIYHLAAACCLANDLANLPLSLTF